MTVFAVLNQKGGVGKTTLTLNLAHQWATQGLKVLVVDVDKQAAATASLVAEDLDPESVTIADVLREDQWRAATRLSDAVRMADRQWSPIYLVPAALDLEDVWTSSKPGLVFRLRRALDEADVHSMYDRVILDGPPDLGPGTVAAAVAADAVVIPTRPERMSMHGVARTVETLRVVQRDMRPDVQLAGIVPVAVDTRLREHLFRLDELQRLYGDDLTTAVPHRLKADEASGAGRPAAYLDGLAGPTFARTYTALCKELDERTAR